MENPTKMDDFFWGISQSGGFLSHGGTTKFSIHKPSSYWGTPIMEAQIPHNITRGVPRIISGIASKFNL